MDDNEVVVLYHKDHDGNIVDTIRKKLSNAGRKRVWIPTNEEYQFIYDQVFLGTPLKEIAPQLGINFHVLRDVRTSNNKEYCTEAGVNVLDLVICTAIAHRNRPIRRKLYEKAMDDNSRDQMAAIKYVLADEDEQGDNRQVMINVGTNHIGFTREEQYRLIDIAKGSQ